MNEHSDQTREVLNWFKQNTMEIKGFVFAEPLGDAVESFFRKGPHAAQVFGLGEMTHGASEVVRGRFCLLRHLIQEHGVRVIILESEMSRTKMLNDCLLSGEGNLDEALSATGSFLAANHETLEFMEWLSEFNVSQHSDMNRVRVFGCDMQSSDGLRAMLMWLLNETTHESQSWLTMKSEILTRLSRLPTDEQLAVSIELYFEEISSGSQGSDRAAKILESQVDFVDSAMPIIDDISFLMKELASEPLSHLSHECRVYFDRCTQMLRQCYEHYRFDRGSESRDRSMAENILAIREQFSGQKIALLAANLHVARACVTFEGFGDYITTGSLIAAELGDEYLAIGTAFYSGIYVGVAGNTPNETVFVESHLPREGTFEFLLHSYAVANKMPNFLLDIRSHRLSGSNFPWPECMLMHLGEAAPQQSYEATFVPQSPHRQYDALLFVTKTTPSTILDSYYRMFMDLREENGKLKRQLVEALLEQKNAPGRGPESD